MTAMILVVLLLFGQRGGVFVPGQVDNLIRRSHTIRLQRHSAAQSDAGTIECEGGVNRRTIQTIAYGSKEELALPVNHLLLAVVAIGQVADAD